MTQKTKAKIAKMKAAYNNGVHANRLGMPDENPYSMSSPMEFCAWSAGYFDSMRGVA